LQKLGKPLPHIAFEAFFPAEWFGFERLRAETRLRINIFLVNYYRELTMSWSTTSGLQPETLPGSFRTVILGESEQRTEPGFWLGTGSR
jgi:hypothetical protein